MIGKETVGGDWDTFSSVTLEEAPPAKPATADPYVSRLLHESADLYAQRNAVYKDNYKMVGKVMQALFPKGMQLQSEEDYNRWHLLELAIVKLTRYVQHYETGGHKDSIEDMIVYFAMVAGLDQQYFGDESSAQKEP